MSSLSAINILFKVDMKQFSTEMQNSLRDIKKLGESFEKVGAAFSIGVTAPVVAFGYEAVKAFDVADKGLAQMDAALKSTGGMVGLTSKQLEEMAVKFQKNSTFDHADIMKESTANLLTFDKIVGSTFEKAQQAALDLSTRFGGDLQTATIQVGKALQDPIKGVTALSKAGVSFSAGQKATIKSMVETNDIAGAQAIILKELNKEFGGSAEAASKAGTGGLQQLKNQMADLSEEFGKIIVDAIKPFVSHLSSIIEHLQQLSPETKKTIAVVAGLAAAIGPLLLAMGTVLTLVPNMVAGFKMVSGAFSAMTSVLTANPYVALGIAIGAVALALYGWYSNSKQAASGQEALNDAVAKGNKQAEEEIGSLDKLYATATNVKLSTDERRGAVEKLQALYPAYFKNIDEENIKNGKAKNVYNELRDAIFDKARAMAIENELQNRANARVEKELELKTKIANAEKNLIAITNSKENNYTTGSFSNGTEVVVTKQKAIEDFTKALKKQREELSAFTNDAKQQDQILIDSKEDYDKKSKKLQQNQIDITNATRKANEDAGKSLEKLLPGTKSFYDQQINDLKEHQLLLANNNDLWNSFAERIDVVQKKIDALQAEKKINLPKPEQNYDISTPPTFKLSDYDEQLQALENLRKSFSDSKVVYDSFETKINNTKLKIQAIEGVEDVKKGFDIIQQSLDDTKSKYEELRQKATIVGSAVGSAFETLSSGLINSLGTAKTGLERFEQSLLKSVSKIIASLLSQSIAYAIAGSAEAAAASGIAAPVTMPVFMAEMIGAVIGAFAAIPKFETGGIIGGSSYYGDKILARVNSGELILNNQQQQAVFNGMNKAASGAVNIVLGGGFEIEGTKLRLVLDRTDKILNRR